MSEEQREEIEVLMSIFPDEFQSIEAINNENNIRFKLHLLPNPGGGDKNFGIDIY